MGIDKSSADEHRRTGGPGGLVVEHSPATRETRVRFPARIHFVFALLCLMSCLFLGVRSCAAAPVQRGVRRARLRATCHRTAQGPRACLQQLFVVTVHVRAETQTCKTVTFPFRMHSVAATCLLLGELAFATVVVVVAMRAQRRMCSAYLSSS